MQVVGQCPGDNRIHEDLIAVEQCIATPQPPEQEDDDLVSQEKRGVDQDAHAESRFREELAKRRPTSRSQPAANSAHTTEAQAYRFEGLKFLSAGFAPNYSH